MCKTSIRNDQARTDFTSRRAPGSVPSSTLLAPGWRWRRMELREVKDSKTPKLFVTEMPNRLGRGPRGSHNFQEVKNCSLDSDQRHLGHPWCCLHQEWQDRQVDLFLNNKSSSVTTGIFRFLMIAKNAAKPETQEGSFEPSVATRVVSGHLWCQLLPFGCLESPRRSQRSSSQGLAMAMITWYFKKNVNYGHTTLHDTQYAL